MPNLLFIQQECCGVGKFTQHLEGQEREKRAFKGTKWTSELKMEIMFGWDGINGEKKNNLSIIYDASFCSVSRMDEEDFERNSLPIASRTIVAISRYEKVSLHRRRANLGFHVIQNPRQAACSMRRGIRSRGGSDSC